MRCHFWESRVQVEGDSVAERKLTVKSMTIEGASSQPIVRGVEDVNILEGETRRKRKAHRTIGETSVSKDILSMRSTMRGTPYNDKVEARGTDR